MKRNSVFAVAREALRQHSGWGRTWGNPEAKKAYDVVIIGAGGHGLATAYYLGKNFGITNVAVIEKAGWAVATQGATRLLFAQTTCKTLRRRSMKRRALCMRR